MEYTLVYDVSTGEFPWGIGIIFVFSLIAGIVFIVKNESVITKPRTRIIFGVFWLTGFLLFGGLGVTNVLSHHLKYKKMFESQDYKIVEGLVENFHPMPMSGHDTERFTVGGIKFEYSDFDLSKGGFNNTSSHGGPIREGLPVRIAYKNGRILKLEIGKI